MRIDDILAAERPVFSFEFFPPRDEAGVELLFETVEALKPLEPAFVSVTYGAGGATREGTVEIAYMTFPPHERQGHATAIIAELIAIANEHGAAVAIARTGRWRD